MYFLRAILMAICMIFQTSQCMQLLDGKAPRQLTVVNKSSFPVVLELKEAKRSDRFKLGMLIKAGTMNTCNLKKVPEIQVKVVHGVGYEQIIKFTFMGKGRHLKLEPVDGCNSQNFWKERVEEFDRDDVPYRFALEVLDYGANPISIEDLDNSL